MRTLSSDWFSLGGRKRAKEREGESVVSRIPYWRSISISFHRDIDESARATNNNIKFECAFGNE